MILIFSSNNDITTQEVISWLHYNKTNPVIINEFNPIIDINIAIDKSHTSVTFLLKSGEFVDTKNVNVVWYRKGVNFFELSLSEFKKNHLNIFLEHLKSEHNVLCSFLFSHLKDKTIGDYHLTENNKLYTLICANLVGLNIPKTTICNCKKSLKSQTPLINKTIGDIITTKIYNTIYFNRTTEVNFKIIPDNFYPSLFQTAIKKQFELRIFYFDSDFYTMAIFAQQNEKTRVDFRDFTQQSLLMNVPFKLPDLLKSKLEKLILMLGYTSCSIDLLVDENNNYIFLEINPVGQFGMVSTPCNYYIEKEIAKKLIKYAKKTFRRTFTSV